MPMTPRELAAKTPIIATAKKPPKSFDANKRTLYVSTSNAQPTVEFVEVERGRRRCP